METYEKKYKDLIARLQKAKENDGDERYCCVIDEIAPELSESEDERIRKDIMDFIDTNTIDSDERRNRWLAWLEKQGKQKEYTFKSIPRLLDMIEPSNKAKAYCQKLIDTLVKEGYAIDAKIVGVCLKTMNGEDVPMAIMDEKQGEYKFEMKSAEESLGISSEEYNDIVNECLYGESNYPDKVEPKFKVGDWVVFKNRHQSIYQVEKIEDGYYILRHTHGGTFRVCVLHDESLRLWDITKDARDGDVLASELCDSIILFRGIKDNNVDFYCDYDFSKIDIPGDRFSINDGQHYGDVEDSKDFHPASKEQRDTLFAKMREAGYEWNAETKKLKKIEKKSAEWSDTEKQEIFLRSQRPHFWRPSDEQMDNK